MLGSQICCQGRIFGFGPCGNQRPQGCIGGKHPVVAVAVDAGRWKDGGKAVEELHGGEAEPSATGWIG